MEAVDKSKTVEEEAIIPKYILEQLSSLEDKQLKIREKLGFFTEKRTDNPLKILNDLFKKFDIWREKNQASREIVCPFCSKLFFLKIRTDKYEAYKSPFFIEDKVLTNRPLLELYKKGKITIEETASVLGVSTDYIKWLEDKSSKVPDSVNPSL